MGSTITQREYYKTPHWRKFRKKLLEDINCQCELCGRKHWAIYQRGSKKGSRRQLLRFNVHHKHYTRLYNEHREDVLVLCQFCHDLCHSIEQAAVLTDIYVPLLEILVEETIWEYTKRKKTKDRYNNGTTNK